MNKDNLNSQNNQVCHQRKLINRRNKKLQAYASFKRKPNLKELKDSLTRSMRGRKQILHKLLHLVMQYSRYGIDLYANEKTIAKKFGCSEKALSRVIGQASDMGIIHARQRGFNETNEYFLNPAMRIPAVQHALSPFFSFLKVFALQLLLSSASHTCLDDRLVKFKTTDVTLIKKGYYSINRHRSAGEQAPKKPKDYINICGSVESCEKDLGETEIVYMGWSERVAREGLEYAVDPRDIQGNKGSIEDLFLPEVAPFEATSESFDNREYETFWERDMEEPVPYFAEDGEWEEVDYVNPVPPETEPDIFSEVAHSDEEIELAFERVKIQLDNSVPMVPVDTGERLVSRPSKPWNAPAWRKVAGQEEVETLTEFINRVTKKKGNYD